MNPSTWLSSLGAVTPAFIDAALRGAVVLLLALALTHLMRKRTAAARHLVWVGAIVVQLALPFFALWGPQWRLAVPAPVASLSPVALPTSASGTSTEVAGPTQRNDAVLSEAKDLHMPAPKDLPVREPAASAIDGRTLLLALWALGALVILGRLAIGTSIVAALARRGARVEDGSWLSLAQRLSAALQIDRPLTLLRGDKLGVPVTWGIVYPVVLLPDDADSWPEERRRFVLVHEMAHVKRLDALTQLAGQLALALFWFDPLVWIANRRMQLEREHACDDYVLRHGTAPSMYAEELLAMVRAIGTPDHRTAQPAFAALAMARRSEFEGRMLSILDPVLDRHPLSKGRTVLGALAALLLVIPLAALHPYQRIAAPTVASAPPASIPQDVVRKPADTANDLPEMFKVSILPSTPTGGPPAMVITPSAPASSAAPPAAPAASASSAKTPSCDDIDFRRTSASTSTSIHADVGESSSVIVYTRYNSERCSSATIIGKLAYTAGEDDIVGMPPGSHAAFRTRTPNDDKMLTITRAPDGTLDRAYRADGQSAPYDDSARRWFASYLPTVLMETGINVGPRVARLRAQGGVPTVLDRIATMASSSAKRSHYEALLSGAALSGEELDKVVRSASENLGSSSSDLRAVLEHAMPSAKLSRQSASALETAVSSMSSADKTAVLQQFGETADRDMLLSVMRVAQTITSSGDKARLLQALAARYLSGGDRGLQDAYFDVVEHIASSGDMRNTLMIAMSYNVRNADVTRRIIRAARSVASSGDRSQVLIALVSSGVVNTKELRDSFMTAAAEVESEGDRMRVLSAAAPLKP